MDAALRGLRERGYNPPVILDIGAAAGGWSRHALRYWPASRFYCIEALEERRKELELLQGSTAHYVTVLICGVADHDGKLRMGITDSLWDSSFAYEGRSSREIEVFSLDTLLSQSKIEPPSFLKLDVQGYEIKILEGGKISLSRCDVILMECQFYKFCPDMRTLDKTIIYMSNLGFVPYEIVDVLRRPLDGAMGQCDFLFVRREHWLVSDSRWVAAK
jgi:methyltransferase, FkbM family